MFRKKKKKLNTIGWREWVQLPKLHIDHIKAKIDTGAKTSTLHAIDIEPYYLHGQLRVKFFIHPIQRNEELEVKCFADVIDIRTITDSGGKKERRYVILTPIIIDKLTWDIELTLTNRKNMGFRMLLGRAAIKNKFLVNPGASYLQKVYK